MAVPCTFLRVTRRTVVVVGSGDDAELERIESKCLLVNQAFFQYVAHHVIVRHTLRCVLPLLWAYFRLFCRACRKYIFKTALFVSGTYSDGTFRSTFGLKDLDQGIVARPQRQTLFGYRCPVAITLAKHQPPRKIRVVRNRQHLTISLALQIEPTQQVFSKSIHGGEDIGRHFVASKYHVAMKHAALEQSGAIFKSVEGSEVTGFVMLLGSTLIVLPHAFCAINAFAAALATHAVTVTRQILTILFRVGKQQGEHQEELVSHTEATWYPITATITVKTLMNGSHAFGVVSDCRKIQRCRQTLLLPRPGQFHLAAFGKFVCATRTIARIKNIGVRRDRGMQMKFAEISVA